MQRRVVGSVVSVAGWVDHALQPARRLRGGLAQQAADRGRRARAVHFTQGCVCVSGVATNDQHTEEFFVVAATAICACFDS